MTVCDLQFPLRSQFISLNLKSILMAFVKMGHFHIIINTKGCGMCHCSLQTEGGMI